MHTGTRSGIRIGARGASRGFLIPGPFPEGPGSAPLAGRSVPGKAVTLQRLIPLPFGGRGWGLGRSALVLLLCVVCAAFAPALPARAAPPIFTVNRITDVGLTTCVANGGAMGPACELRDAVSKAPAGSTIVFDPATTNGQTITVGSTMLVTASVTITGNGATNTTIAYTGGTAAALTVRVPAALTLSGLTFSGSGVDDQSSGALSVSDSIFTGNGVGIYTQASSPVTVNRVLFSGLSNDALLSQGNSAITITNSTFSGNGTGVYNDTSGPIVIVGSTFSGNTIAVQGNGSVTVTDSILAASGTANCSGSFIFDGGHNLAYGTGGADTTCPATFTRNADPNLAALATNGATNGVQTFALLAGSPAIDGGICTYTDAQGSAGILATDARGVGRPRGAACDSGSYEAASAVALVVNRAADDKSDALCQPLMSGGCTLREAVNASNANDPGAGYNTITFAAATNGATTTLPSEIDLIQNVTITGNGAGSTLIAYTGNGGGALTVQDPAALTLSGVTLSGGFIGVYTPSSGAVSVSDSVFSGSNIGIYSQGNGPITVNRVLFSALTNTAIIAGYGALTITNSAFSGNGFGVSNNNGVPAAIVGSTFSGNRTALTGGVFTVTDSILAASTNRNCNGPITDGGHNFAYGTSGADTTCAFTQSTSHQDRDPKLAPLATNGATNGVTTFALLPGSPAIDGGICTYTDAQGNAGILATDARGVGRPRGAACDSGSYEAAAPVTYVVNRAADDKSDAVCQPLAMGGCTLREAVNASNANDPGAGYNTITFDAATNGATTTLPNEIDLTASVTLTGNGATNTHIAYTGNTNGALTVQGSAALTLSGVTLSGGFADLYTQSSGALAVTDSAFTTGNISIYTAGSGAVTVNRTLFSALTNTALLSFANGPVTVTNSTFSGNDFGVSNQSFQPLVIAGSTFSGNSFALSGLSFTVTDSIVAGSTSQNCADPITDGGHNLAYGTNSADTTCAFTQPTSHQDRDPKLAPLAANGATNGVQTFALLPGSPAIDTGICTYTDAGGTAQTLTTDARGITRPQGSACDSGSFESRGFTTGTPTGNNQTALVNAAFAQPVGLTVASANGEPVSGGQVTFTITPGAGSATFPAAGACTLTSGTVAVCPVNAMGVVTSPGFTANGTAGGFTILATASGIATPFTFTETNTLPTPVAYVVNRAADDKTDAVCQPLAMAGCTLREAVNASNANDPGAGNHNTITFDPAVFPAGGPSQTITLTTASGGALVLTRAVTLTAPGQNALTVSGNNTSQVFVVPSGGTATISGLTATAGYAVAANGGAISVRIGGALTLTDSTVTASHTTVNGGGLFINGPLTMQRVTVSGNRSDAAAGGIGVGGAGIVRIEASTITKNRATGSDGGLGFFNGAPDATVLNTTVDGNTSGGPGGGVGNEGHSLALTNVTITNNTVTGAGNNAGGIAFFNSGTLNDSIVAGNTAPMAPNNAFGSFTGANNITDVNALLAPLGAYNGGSGGTTPTRPPLPGSPAIDAGSNATCTATDQRGIARPIGAACDIGAVESQGFTTSAPTGNNQSALVNAAYMNPVGLTVSSANSEPVSGGQVTFTITPGAGSATFPAAGACTLTSGTVAVCPVNAMGVATSPGFTANGTAGGFTILATASGIATPFTFTETNRALPATHFSVTGFPSPATAGVSGTVIVTALDASNTTVTGYSGTVAITSSDPAAVLPANGTLTNGVGSFAVTLKTAGTQSLTATDTTTSSITGAQTGITVNPGPTARFVVSGFPSSIAAGTAANVTVTAQDAFANIATGYSGTVKITTTDPAATLPANAPLTNGVGSFAVTFATAGTQSITATDTVTASITGAQTGIQVTTTTLITRAPTGMGSGNSGTASAPMIRVGASLTLTTTLMSSNGMSGAAMGVTYTGYDSSKVSVDAMGNVTALAPGTTTIMVSAPDGKGGTVTTTITVTVTGGTGGGLMNPNPQPMAHATAPAQASAAAQPTRKPDGGTGNGSGAQPQAAGPTPAATATPQAQPARR